MNKNKSFADSLSTHGKNGLIGCLEDADIIYQPEKVAEGRAKLTLARNIGVKSLKEIALRFDVNQDEALLQIVERATAKEFNDNFIQKEVKNIITSKKPLQKDRFDFIVGKSLVMDLKETKLLENTIL